jgi:hypothetical protein
VVSGIHLLPFYPVVVGRRIFAEGFLPSSRGMGTWDDITRLGSDSI